MTLAVYDAQVDGNLRNKAEILQALQDLLQID